MTESRPSVDEYGRGYRDGLAEAERQIAALEESRDRLGRELATAHAGVGMERARGDKALARVAQLEAQLAARDAVIGEVRGVIFRNPPPAPEPCEPIEWWSGKVREVCAILDRALTAQPAAADAETQTVALAFGETAEMAAEKADDE